MTHETETLADVLQWLPSSIEPGVPDVNYRDIANRCNVLMRQRLILDLDELAGRHRHLLRVASFDIPVEGDEIHWELCDIRLDQSVEHVWDNEALKCAERAVVEVIRLLQESFSSNTEAMIANMLYDFGGSYWTPEVMEDMCSALANTLGLTDRPTVWLAGHRAFRQAKQIADATPISSVSPARTRL